jgi:hypothetical protein
LVGVDCGHATVQTTIPARLYGAAPHGADGFRFRSIHPTGSRLNVEIVGFGALESQQPLNPHGEEAL